MVRFKGTGRFGKAFNELDDRLTRVETAYGRGVRFTAGPRGVVFHTTGKTRGNQDFNPQTVVPRWG